MRQHASVRIAVVIAHPDDETTMAGTIAHYAGLGAQILVVCATNGAGGATGGIAMSEPLGSVRQREMRRACQVLGVSEVVFLEDTATPHLGKHNYANVMGAQAYRTSEHLTHFRPDVLLTFGQDGVTGHATHIMVGAMARRACVLADVQPVVHLVGYRVSEVQAVLSWLDAHPEAWQTYREEVEKKPNIGAPTPEFFPIPPVLVHVVIDVSSHRRVRLDAARWHQSQGGLGYLEAYVAPDVECFAVLDDTGEPVLGPVLPALVTSLSAGQHRTA